MLIIKDLKKKRKYYYEYEEIYDGMTQVQKNNFFKKLYKDNDHIKAHCSCVPGRKIPLVISKHNKTYYIKRQSSKTKHSPHCKFDGEYELAKNGWNLEEDNNIRVFLKNRIFSYNEYQNSRITDFLTLREFIYKFVGFSWEIQTKQAIRYGRPPIQLEHFIHSLYYLAKRIKLSDETTLHDLMGLGKKKAYELLQKRQRMFVLLPLKEYEDYDEDNILVKVYNPGQKYDISLMVDKTLWREEYKKVPVKRGNIIVGAFVELKKDKPLIVKHLSIFSATSKGLIVKNRYHRKLANRMHLLNKHFVTTVTTYKGFDKYQPDFLLLNEYPQRIIEVFTEKNNNQYYIEEDKRINYFNSLKDYKVQVWDAVNKEKLYFIVE